MKINLKKGGSKIKDLIQIDSFDLWNLDETLSKIIAPCLIKFKEELLNSKAKSFPQSFSDSNLPDFLENSYGKQPHRIVFDEEDDYFQNWVEAIDLMIYSFTEISLNNPSAPEFKEPHISSCYETFEPYRLTEEQELENEIWFKEYSLKKDEYYKKIQIGLDLFAKNLNNLWN